MNRAAPACDDLVKDPFYGEIKRVVVEKTGLAYYLDKDEELARILLQRMAASGAKDAASYLVQLTDPKSAAEQDALISELTIGETYFFRHPEVFAALKADIIPEILQRKAGAQRLNIWSAGCSSGAEVHSIAILLKSAFAKEIPGWKLDLIGTDIDKKFLEQARSGLYHNWALRATTPSDRDLHFEEAPLGWRLKNVYRECVTFHHHNLIQDALPLPGLGLDALDLILCRNVAIYFSREQVQALMRRFLACLNEGGWLITGPAEFGMDKPPGFRAVNLNGLIVYRKEGAGQAGPAKPQWTPPLLTDPPAAAETALQRALDEAATEAVEEPSPGGQGGDDAELAHLVQRGQWIAAMGPARRVLAGEAPNLDSLFKAVQVLTEVGDYEGAERALKRRLFIDRKCQMAYYHLGLVHMCRGDEGMAAKAFRNAYDLAMTAPADQPVAGGEGLTSGRLAALVGLRASPRKSS